MNVIDFLDHFIRADKVLAVGPVGPVAAVAAHCFEVHLEGGTSLSFSAGCGAPASDTDSLRGIFLKKWLDAKPDSGNIEG